MKMKLSDDELVYILEEQLPAILERHPEMEVRVYHAFMKTFATKAEVAAVVNEVREFRAETAENFTKVDQRLRGSRPISRICSNL